MTVRMLAVLLLALAGRAAGQVPYVFLDHVAVSVDSATYRSIQASAFVHNELAGTRRDSSATEDGLWAGTVLTGENNFIALSAGRRGSELVLRCEQRDCSRDIAQVWNSMTPGIAVSELRHRTDAGGGTPWHYRTWTRDMRSDGFFCWFSEPYPDSGVPDKALGRKAMNARWYKPKRLLGNIVDVGVTVESEVIRSLTHRLSAFHFGAMFSGSTTVLRGPDLRIMLTPSAGDAGRITRIVFTLNRAKKGRKEYRFGPSSVLTFDNKTLTATWTF